MPSTSPTSAVNHTGRPLPEACLELLNTAARGLATATAATAPGERFAEAHLSALRAAAAVLAGRAKPGAKKLSGPSSVWVLLPEVAPELGEWAVFFAAGAGKRAAAAAGIPVVGSREADDLLRDAARFLVLAEAALGLGHETTRRHGLPLTG